MSLIKCPDCGKLVVPSFPLHHCPKKRLFEITRKTKRSVRFKPYGATNRAASLTLSREDFDRLYQITEPGICVRRPTVFT